MGYFMGYFMGYIIMGYSIKETVNKLGNST